MTKKFFLLCMAVGILAMLCACGASSGSSETNETAVAVETADEASAVELLEEAGETVDSEKLEENVKYSISCNLIFKAVAYFGGNQSLVSFSSLVIDEDKTVISYGYIFGYDENGDGYKVRFYREDTIGDIEKGTVSTNCIYVDWTGEMSASEVKAAAREQLAAAADSTTEEDEKETLYHSACTLYEEGQYVEAFNIFYSFSRTYSDAWEKADEIFEALFAAGDIEALSQLDEWYYRRNDAIGYEFALLCYENNERALALKYFEYASGYEDADYYYYYLSGLQYIDEENYGEALAALEEVIDVFDDVRSLMCQYGYIYACTGEVVSIDNVAYWLSLVSERSDKEQELLDFCTGLMEYEGKYTCYQKMKSDGTITTKDISCSVTFSFYFSAGTVYGSVKNSLFHDTTLYDAVLYLSSEDGYDYQLNCYSSASTKKTEDFYFSLEAAMYSGYSSSNIYYYSR